MHQNKNQHTPVLLKQVLQYLDPRPGESLLDLTAGYGGHASAILDRTMGKAMLVDRDTQAVEYLRKMLNNPKIQIVHDDFWQICQKLVNDKEQYDLILADLGVSSPHLNIASRGFSFNIEGPLDMRMDTSQTLTADFIVNSYSEKNLAKLISLYGEEPKAKKIAKAIVLHHPVRSTTELANIISQVVKPKGKSHPATKTFQALRIAVNDELELLQKALPLWLELLKPGGRIAVISFHSLEDRLVKQIFKDAGGRHYEATLNLLSKHAISADYDEIVTNPRARSARLRVAAKIKTNKEGKVHANSGKK